MGESGINKKFSIDNFPSREEIEKVADNRFYFGRIRAVIAESDPDNKLKLVQDTMSIAKLFNAFRNIDSPEDAVINVVKIMHADRNATVDTILEDIALKNKQ